METHVRKGEIAYWLKGQEVQNFGDYIAEYLMTKVFTGVPQDNTIVYLCGSVIHDPYLKDVARHIKIIYWGCGCREKTGISDAFRPYVDILAVRGPLTRRALGLPQETPYGDPALLLPSLYQARPQSGEGHSLCIPHFLDDRTDAELLALSGCTKILRMGIPRGLEKIEGVIDEICGAAFVLSASLHGAIVSAAYGVPFAFWQNGSFDIIFKWVDFAASVNIPCKLAENLESGMHLYESEIMPSLRIPPLWRLLAAAPFKVKPAVFASAIAHDMDRHGRTSFDEVRSRPGDKTRSTRVSILNGETPSALPPESAHAIDADKMLKSAVDKKLHSFFPSVSARDVVGKAKYVVLHEATIDTRDWLIFHENRVILPNVQHWLFSILDRKVCNSNNFSRDDVLEIKNNRHLPRLAVANGYLLGGNDNYYHHTVDYLSAAYFLADVEEDTGSLLPIVDCKRDWQVGLLDVFVGKQRNVLQVRQDSLVAVERLYIPRKCFQVEGELNVPGWFSWIRKKADDLGGKAGRNRLYVSRKKTRQRKIQNEAGFEGFLAGMGFRTVITEELSVPEQIRLFRDAEVVVSAHGAGLTNLIYCKTGAAILELMPENGWKPPHFANLCKSAELRHSIIHCGGKFDDEEFVVDFMRVSDALKELGIA